LPLTATVEEATLVHASPRSPDEWDYIMSAEDGFEVFGAFETRLCFVGHSHRAGLWSLGSSGPDFVGGPGFSEAVVALEDGRRYLVNVGSVGQPRDRDPRAAYVIWDREARTVAVRRVVYDHRAAAGKILAAGLPRVLADRLADGV
jgi:diadenosine tetraphosphatase ApaH/serine/threonine PP2A family protein phosphatase